MSVCLCLQPVVSSVTAGEQAEVHLNAARWLQQAPAHSFDAWKTRKAKRGRDPAKGASVSTQPNAGSVGVMYREPVLSSALE